MAYFDFRSHEGLLSNLIESLTKNNQGSFIKPLQLLGLQCHFMLLKTIIFKLFSFDDKFPKAIKCSQLEYRFCLP